MAAIPSNALQSAFNNAFTQNPFVSFNDSTAAATWVQYTIGGNRMTREQRGAQAKPKQKKAAGPLAWLDERVEEMRVKL